MTISELKSKEVINVSDCRKLGNICDFEVEPCEGKIISFFVPGECGVLGFGKPSHIRICYSDIEKIGDDIILVNLRPELLSPSDCKSCKPKKKGFFF